MRIGYKQGLQAALMLIIAACQMATFRMDDYRLAIETAGVSDASDRRLELTSCVQKWEAFKKERSSVYKLLARKRVFELPKFLFIEVGTSAFGKYEYAFLYRDDTGGHLMTNMHGVSTPINAISVSTDVESLFKKIEAAQPIKGLASSKVDDGECIFVNFKHENNYSQFALYAPEEQGVKGDNKPYRIVNLILEFISRSVFSHNQSNVHSHQDENSPS